MPRDPESLRNFQIGCEHDFRYMETKYSKDTKSQIDIFYCTKCLKYVGMEDNGYELVGKSV